MNLNKQAILNARHTYSSPYGDREYITDSALLPTVVIGVSDSPEESVRIHEELLEDTWVSFETDMVAGYTGTCPNSQINLPPTNLLYHQSKYLEKVAEVKKLTIEEALNYIIHVFAQQNGLMDE